MNTGAKPKNVDVEEEEILDNNSSKETNVIERDFGSSDGQEVVLVSESSPIDPTTLSSNSPSSEPPSSSSNFKLPEGPPNRSPLPPEWSQNREISNLSKTYLIAKGILPIQPPVREIIKKNPSVRNYRSAPSSPIRRLRSASDCLGQFGRRSPLLGVSALVATNKPDSADSLDWDGLVNTPSYYRRPTPIPVISTPSTSLDSTPARDFMPSPAAPFRTPVQRQDSNMTETLAADVLALQLSKKDVENLIEMFPPEHMTLDRLPVYNDELKEIKDSFRNFSANCLLFP